MPAKGSLVAPRPALAAEEAVPLVWIEAHARQRFRSQPASNARFIRGYVVYGRVNGGLVNVCGLFRRRTGESVGPQNRREWLRGPIGFTVAPAPGFGGI